MKTTLVLGASPNPKRYAYIATLSLMEKGHKVALVGVRSGEIGGVKIITDKEILEGIHTISIYLNPIRQKEWVEYILETQPKRLIFNPGAENRSLQALAESQGIETIDACTLVMLASGLY